MHAGFLCENIVETEEGQ